MRIILSVLAQLLFVSCALVAQLSNPPVLPFQSEMGKWWKNSETVNKLKLSEAQVNQIEQIFLDHRSRLANLNSDLKTQEEAMRKLMEANPLNEGAVRAQLENVLASRSELQRVNSTMMLSIRNVLSKEQWEKLEEAKKSDIYVAADGIKLPITLFRPMPPYTQAGKENRIQGLVLLEAVVRKDGTVDSIKVIKGLGYGLDESAIDTIAKQWRFAPGKMQNGEPVDTRVTIEVSFRLF